MCFLCCGSVEVKPQIVDHEEQPKEDNTRGLLLLGAENSATHSGNVRDPENALRLTIIRSNSTVILHKDTPRP